MADRQKLPLPVNTQPGTTGRVLRTAYKMIYALMQGNPDATAVLESSKGILHSITVGGGGSGYTDSQAVTVSGSGTANTKLTSTTIDTLTITGGGSRYKSAPTVTISAPGGGGVTCTASATVGSRAQQEAITGLTITNAGSGYTSAPTVTIAGPGGGGGTATAVAICSKTSVASITVTGGGSYTSAPTAVIPAPQTSGSTATVSAVTVGFEIDSITLTNPPDEKTKISHSSASQATFSADLSGATKTANTTLTNGVITAVTPTDDGGAGLYATVPTVNLPVPPKAPFTYSFDDTFTVSEHGADVFLDNVSLFNGVLSSIDTSIIRMNVSFFYGTTEQEINVLSNNNQGNSYMLSHTNTNAQALAILHQTKYNYLLYLPPGSYNKVNINLTPSKTNASMFNTTGSGHRIDVNFIVKDRSSDVVDDVDDVDDVNRPFNPIYYT